MIKFKAPKQNVLPIEQNMKLVKAISSDKLQVKLMREYGEYVLEERAIPDFRDGLKPVQRRILYSMHEQGILWNKNFSKSASVVGRTMAQYHPHGDSSIYSAMVNLAQAGKNPTRYPYIQGQGNWGSETDDPAASRYTEARLDKKSKALFECMAVTPMVDNYSGTCKEPLVLSARLPYLILNGSEGIAVGTATNIPSHNIKEVLAALTEILTNKSHTQSSVLKHLKGPDYNGGIILSDTKEIQELYTQGHGSISYKCQYHFEDNKSYKALVVTSYCPRFNPLNFMNKIQRFSADGLNLIVLDESSEDNGLRLVVEYKNPLDINEYVIPELTSKIGYNFNITERISEEEVRFRHVTMYDFLTQWLDYRREIETELLNKQKSDLELAHKKELAVLAVLDNHKAFFTLLKDSDTLEDDLKKKPFSFDTVQIDYVLGKATRTYSKLNREKQLELLESIKKDIQSILEKLNDIDKWILELLNSYSFMFDERRTLIGAKVEELDQAKLLVFADNKNLVRHLRNEPIKVKTWKYDFVVYATKGMWSIDSHGLITPWKVNEIIDGNSGYDLFGLSSEKTKYILGFTEKGLCAICEPPQRQNYALKVDQKDKFKNFVEIRLNSTVWVWDDELEKIVSWDYDKLSDWATRPNTKGWQADTSTVNAISIPDGGAIVSEKGTPYTTRSFLRALSDDKKWYVIGKMNLAIFADGSKEFIKKDALLTRLANKEKLINCFPI